MKSAPLPASSSKIVRDVVVIGKSKSGRVWKEVKKTRFGAVYHQTPTPAVHPSYSKRRDADARQQAMKDVVKSMKAEKQAEKETEKERIKAKREAKAQRELQAIQSKGQVVKNVREKMKKMNRKQLRSLVTG